MKLLLTRQTSTEKCTPGKLFIDDELQCFTLEDIVRPDGEKVYGKTAIPAGIYDVELTESPKFGRIMPAILNVPNFEGIRIHYGNTDTDTDGCVLVGLSYSKDFLGQSRAAFDPLFAKLEAATDSITIEIRSAA